MGEEEGGCMANGCMSNGIHGQRIWHLLREESGLGAGLVSGGLGLLGAGLEHLG